MDLQTTEHFKTLFQDLYKDTLTNYQKAGEEVFVEQVRGDSVDLSLASKDQQLQIKLKGREIFFLRKIENALERIDNGEFGLCQECDDEIAIERLKARPTSCLCIHCKEEQERKEGHILYKNKSHTGGKDVVSNVVPIGSANEDIAKTREFHINKSKAQIGLVNIIP